MIKRRVHTNLFCLSWHPNTEWRINIPTTANDGQHQLYSRMTYKSNCKFELDRHFHYLYFIWYELNICSQNYSIFEMLFYNISYQYHLERMFHYLLVIFQTNVIFWITHFDGIFLFSRHFHLWWFLWLFNMLDIHI